MKTTVIVEDGRAPVVEQDAEASTLADEAQPADAPIDAGAAPVDGAGQERSPSQNGSENSGPPPAWLLDAIGQARGSSDRADSGGGDVDAGAGPA